MERRRQGSRPTTPGGIVGSVGPTRTGATRSTLAHIQAVLDGGGQIMVGTIAPIKEAAVAHDGKKTLAMLRRRPPEPLSVLLARLDVAIASAQATGSRVDEINTASSSKRYEI